MQACEKLDTVPDGAPLDDYGTNHRDTVKKYATCARRQQCQARWIRDHTE